MDNQKVTVLIDGKKVEAEKGEALLGVCQRNGIDIPTLCHNDQVTPEGRCRMCVTEIRWEQGGRSRIVVSCLYPVDDGLIVDTRSEKVMLVRKTVLELLLARNPEAEGLPELAAEYGIDKAALPAGRRIRQVHPLRPVRAHLPGSGGGGGARIHGPGHYQAGGAGVHGAFAGVHRVRRLRVCLPDRAHRHDRKGRRAEDLGQDLQAGEMRQSAASSTLPSFELEWMSKVTGVPYEKLAICPDCR